MQVKMLDSANKLAIAESQSDSIFVKHYRPAIIVSMFLLIVLNYFGVTSRELPSIFVTIFGSCFGVVPIARSAEKIAEKVIRKRDR